MVSFGSVLSGMIAVILLSIYGYFFITHIRRPVYRDMRFLILLFLIAGIRMLLPINLPLNITIPSKSFLVDISNIAFYIIPGTHYVFLFQIIFIIVFCISLLLIIVKAIKYKNFRNEAEALSHEDIDLSNILSGRPLNKAPEKIHARYADALVSPFVYGVYHPVIIIPENVYSKGELLYVLDHELTHINQNDLLLKTIFDFMTALFWWNPFIWMIKKHADSAIEISNDISLYDKMNEQEKADYASLLVKTEELSIHPVADYSLSLVNHCDPLIKRRVDQILSEPSNRNHLLLPLHISIMLLIIALSFVITVEPYEIHNDQIDGSYDLEEDIGSTDENTYIIESGDHYELYVDGELIAKMKTIPDEFKEYPVYKEKPEE